MKHVTSLPKHLGVLMIAVLLQWCVMPILAQNLKPNMKMVKGKSENPRKEEIKMTTPEKEGYMLLNTKTINGIKCDYYMEGVRTFRFDNGDFVTFTDGTKKGRENRLPFNEGSIGDYKLTDKTGLVFTKENGVAKVELFDGGILMKRTNVDGTSFTSTGELLPPSIYYNLVGDLLYLPDQKEPAEFVRFEADMVFTGRVRNNLDDFKTGGYLFGDRLYAVEDRSRHENRGKIFAYKQVFDNVAYYAIESDTIVEAIYNNELKNLLLKYANGDSLNLSYSQFHNAYLVESGTIHRNGGILTIKDINGKKIKMLTWPNGDKFVGEFYYNPFSPIGESMHSNTQNELAIKDLGEPELKIWEGTLIKADGTRIQYSMGQTEQEIEAENKRQAAQITEEYKQICLKYGKAYVDAALVGKPIVGMPEELLKSVFTLKLVESGTYSTLYHIMGWGWKNGGKTLSDSAHLYSVWVRNGRVSSVRYWGN